MSWKFWSPLIWNAFRCPCGNSTSLSVPCFLRNSAFARRCRSEVGEVAGRPAGPAVRCSSLRRLGIHYTRPRDRAKRPWGGPATPWLRSHAASSPVPRRALEPRPKTTAAQSRGRGRAIALPGWLLQSRRRFLRTLPVAVRGSSSLKTTESGTLNPLSWPRTWSRSSSSVTVDPFTRTTCATGRSPHFS